jgi:uncharacterized protein (TIGR02266 family)
VRLRYLLEIRKICIWAVRALCRFLMDKREAVRVRVQVRARCRSQGVIVDGLVEDVSRSGLFLRASHSIREGTPAELELEIPGEDTLRLAVEVVRIEPGPGNVGMGLRFMRRPERSRSLANFIMRQHQTSR